MVHRLPITKARINLGAVAKRAHLAGEYFILEKDGIPIAGIMGADEMEDYLELQDPKVREQIRASHEEFLAGKHRAAADLLPELKREAKKRLSRRAQKVW
jgi:antitoxin (DNA-binding transcriptional repressor) of toxin-antitoxin stability system